MNRFKLFIPVCFNILPNETSHVLQNRYFVDFVDFHFESYNIL